MKYITSDQANLVSATIYMPWQHGAIDLYFDTPALREVWKIRKHSANAATIERVRLVDFDPIKSRWQTSLPAQYRDLETGREIKAAFAEFGTIARTIPKDEGNSSFSSEIFYKEVK